MSLLMITTTLAGCLGGADVETDEGDDVVLENTDDWPTYYVATASDLPTCPDAANSGKLYYVEDVAEFQACTSAGWTTIDIGGTSANVSMNQPPVIGYSITDIGDEEVNNTSVFLVEIGWSIIDVDGTVQSMGLDNDSDGVIDAPFATQEGFGWIQIMPEIIWERHTDERDADDDGDLETMCVLKLFWAINIIAVDDDGASTIERAYEYEDTYYNSDVQNIETGSIPQADIDWMLDTDGTGPCYQEPAVPMYQYYANDHSDTVDSGTTDSLFVLQFNMASEDLAWADISVRIIGDDGVPYTCTVDAGDGNCKLVQYGSDVLTWEMGEVVHVTENGKAICAAAPCTLTIKISFVGIGIDMAGSGSVVVE
jgi:hypothetical protein